jgi:probable addiction module antidote protein
MAKTRAPRFDAAEYLDSPEAIAEYLSEAFETGDAELITKAIGAVARAQGMSDIARQAGVSRENLYRALGTETKPEFATVMKVLGALGMEIVARPKERERACV